MGALDHAFHEACNQLVPVEAAAQKVDLASPLLVRAPHALSVRKSDELLETLEHEWCISTSDSQDAFVAKKIDAVVLPQLVEPLIELILIYLTTEIQSHGVHILLHPDVLAIRVHKVQSSSHDPLLH